ncbi:MFS transporter [Leucobacter sp. 1207-22]|uniref:MFS transporter n=1 Tax=Leucobacter sp. 1207-22 TaxID=2604456 RepID=UPI0040629A9F
MSATITTEEATIPKRTVRSWAFWDWATQPFNSVILTFVWVSLYLVSDAFLAPEIAAQNADGTITCSQSADASTAYCTGLADLSATYGWITFAAGIIVLLIAPILGQQADARGNKKKWVVGCTAALALIQFAMFFVEADPRYFWFGAIAVAVGSVVSEIAGVSYNAMLFDVSTKKTVGRVSGLGWGLGYIGGIIALLLVVIVTELEWFGMDTSNGMAYRLIAVGAGLWTIVFSLPFFFWVPETAARTERPRVGFFQSYAVLVNDLRGLFRQDRQTFWYLIASAIYRDGLAGIFAFGGILAAVSFGFSATEVMIFGVALNLVAGVATILAGRLDDRFGPRAIIIWSLVILIASALFIFFLREEGKVIFWIGGLVLSAAVGPAQAASRSLLTHLTPGNMQGEVFGLYATTGRVMSFLSPWLWSSFILWFGATHFGILGITIVLVIGLVLMAWLVKKPVRQAPAQM